MPRFANALAAVIPAGPAPQMHTSYCLRAEVSSTELRSNITQLAQIAKQIVLQEYPATQDYEIGLSVSG